jgi:hypothetical protein
MARTKPVPVRRETSSEYISKHDRVLKSAKFAENQVNGGKNDGLVADLKRDTAPAEAGAVQLVIAVAGIYASL